MMKAIAITVFSLLFSYAQASTFSTYCSNSSGSVFWETGHTSNTITFKYYTNEENRLTLPIHEVHIQFENEKILEENEVKECGFYSKTKVYAGKVIISESETSPNSLINTLNERVIKTDVICTFNLTNMMPCMENN
jgi:hypothetical protein